MSDLVKRIDDVTARFAMSLNKHRGSVFQLQADQRQIRNDIIDLLISELEARVEDIIGDDDNHSHPTRVYCESCKYRDDVNGIKFGQRQRAKESIIQLQAMKEGRR